MSDLNHGQMCVGLDLALAGYDIELMDGAFLQRVVSLDPAIVNLDEWSSYLARATYVIARIRYTTIPFLAKHF